MRKFSKKIAMMMALAMLVSMFSGIVSASAASVWSARSVDDDHYAVVMGETIEVKEGEFINFDLFKNIDGEDVEATEAGYEYTWESSDEEVIKIYNNANPKKHGYARVVKGDEENDVVGKKATITVNFKNLKDGKSATRSFGVVVVEELKEAEAVEYKIAANFGDEAFVVGEEYELAAVVTADGKEIDADVVFSIDGVAIEGKYAPAKAGDVTIVATVVIDGEKYAAEYACTVVDAVATKIVDVKQKDKCTVEIIFDAKISEAEAANIDLYQGTVKKNVYKKNLVVKDNVATFTSYKEFADKSEWIFKYGESEFPFTASLGAVKTVVLEEVGTLYTEPEKTEDYKVALNVSFYDENGTKVDPSDKAWIEWKYDTKLIFVEGSNALKGFKVNGIKADDVATLYGIYHSNEFKANASGQYEEYTYTTAPIDIKILKSNAASIAAIAGVKVGEPGATDDKLIDKVPANRYNYNLFVTFVMTDGSTKKAADFTKLSYESTDESKLIVNPTTGNLIPLVTNTTVDVIVNNDKDMVGVVTVVIGDKVKANDPSYTTYKSISNSAELTANAEFKFEGKDNFGGVASYKVDSIKILSMPNTTDENAFAEVIKNNVSYKDEYDNKLDTVTVNPRGLANGNYVFETVVLSNISGDDQKWTKTFSVYVEAAEGNTKIARVELVPTKVEYDTTINKDTKVDAISGSAIEFKIIGYNDQNVAIKEILTSDCTITVKLNGAGDPITSYKLYSAADDGSIVVSGSKYKAIANGAYVFEGKYNDGSADGIKFDSVTVNVKGAQAAPAIGFDKNEVSLTVGNTTKDALKKAIIDTKCFTVPDKTDDYEYTNLTIGDVSLTSLSDTSAAGTYVVRVKNVTVTQKFDSGIEVTFDVPVEKNITIVVKDK